MGKIMKRRNTVVPSEQGFTIIEAMVAITVICMLTIIIGSFLNAAFKTINRIQDTLISTAALLRADEEIRRSVAAISIPYWERHVSILHSPDRTVIPWYDGKTGNVLEFIKTGNCFSINVISDTFSQISLPTGLPGIRSVNLLKDENGNPYGVDLSWEYWGENVHTICRFSLPSPVFTKTNREKYGE
jgi:type II secretory pathway pseudopilin PulG